MTEHESSRVTQGKVRELRHAAEDLAKETKRLKNNLDKMHDMQTLLYSVSKRCVEQCEADARLASLTEPPVNISMDSQDS